MNVSIVTEDDIFIVRPAGKLDALTSPQLKESIDGVLNDGGTLLVIDMSEVAYVSSAGLRVFIRSAKHLMGTGKVAVASLKSSVRQVFDMAGFAMLMSLCDSVEDAKVAVKSSDPS